MVTGRVEQLATRPEVLDWCAGFEIAGERLALGQDARCQSRKRERLRRGTCGQVHYEKKRLKPALQLRKRRLCRIRRCSRVSENRA